MAAKTEKTPAKNTSLMGNMDIGISLGIIGILMVMIIPLPTAILDVLLAMNISLSVMIILVTIYVVKPLDFSVFPSLLLLTTLFRLALNIASTRLILLNGHTGLLAAGKVIKGFGSFAVGGNATVGLVVFVILVVINFVVITKGSGRIAEVAARFTLDAMPGKQMAIDADLNAGLIDENSAKKRRSEVSREAEFYGAMDGASKFVRGDAIAGIIITLVNIVCGLIIGVLQKGLDISTAAQNYTVLTIGDGLVSQIPALIISTGAGILVTRASSEGQNIGSELTSQLGFQPRALKIASVIIFMFGFTPGMPILPFWLLAGGIYLFSRTLSGEKIHKAMEQAEAPKEVKPELSHEEIEKLLPIDPLELEIGYGIIPIVDNKGQGNLLDRIRALRKQFATEMGLVMPSLHIRDNLELKPNEYSFCIKGNEVAHGELMPDQFLAIDPGDARGKIEGIKTKDPAFGLPAIWISPDKKAAAELAEYTVVEPASILTTHLSEVVRQYGYEFLGRQEVQRLMDNVSKSNPRVVDELVPSLLSLGSLQKVLQNLVREQVSIRDLLSVIETLADYAPMTKDTDILTEYVRQKLARSITKPYVQGKKTLKVLNLKPSVEDMIAKGVNQTEYGAYLALGPKDARKIIEQIKKGVDGITVKIEQPVILCSTAIRRHLKKLCDSFHVQVAVFSHNEIPGGLEVQSLGEIG
jgi:flagellar biosynthesis protein FlhA